LANAISNKVQLPQKLPTRPKRRLLGAGRVQNDDCVLLFSRFATTRPQALVAVMKKAGARKATVPSIATKGRKLSCCLFKQQLKLSVIHPIGRPLLEQSGQKIHHTLRLRCASLALFHFHSWPFSDCGGHRSWQIPRIRILV
jgi:hypothetical protein